MDYQKFATSDRPQVHIQKVSGNLRVKGWDRNEIRIDADKDDSFKASYDNDRLELQCSTNCVLRIPNGSSLQIERVDGELYLKSVEGASHIERVSGNLSLRNMGPVSFERVDGNLDAKQVEGDLQGEVVQGGAAVRDIEGTIGLSDVQGSFNQRGLAHGLQAKASGSGTLRLEPEPDGNYQLECGGSLNCRVVGLTGARVRLESETGSIRIKTPEFSDVLDSQQFELTTGDGEAEIVLKAAGRLEFTSSDVSAEYDAFDYEFAEDISNLADEITTQVSDQIEAQIEAINEQLSNLTLQFGSSDSARARAAARRAERKVAKAQHKLEQKLTSARRRAELKTQQAVRRAGSRRPEVGLRWSSNLGNAEAATDPVSDEERQMVLEMLQNGKVSVDEAEALLTALEGQQPEGEENE